MKPVARFFSRALLGGLLAGSALADWTHYRGPNHDGTYPGSIRTDWEVQAPRELWRKPIEPALSSITISGGRAFTQARRRVGSEDREFAVALDAATGAELWAVNLDVADYPHFGVGNDDGPRSTPVIDGDRVYVFTSYLRLYCLEAANGRELWHRDFQAELNADVVAWQNAASPVIVGDLVYVNGNGATNRLMAIRKSDGTTAWRNHDATMTQATPVATTIAGVPQVIFFTRPGLISVRPESGEMLWQFSFPFSTSTAASPVVADDVVYCSAAYTSGSGAVRVSRSGDTVNAVQLWKRRNENMNHWATPVAHEGHLYGLYGQSLISLRCVELATGDEKWRSATVGSRSVGYGSILKVDNLLLVLTDAGEVVLVEPSPDAYRELQKFRAVNGKSWNNPAINDGVLYARSTTEIAAYDVAPPASSAPLRLAPAINLGAGGTRLTVVTVLATDGSPIPPARAAALQILASDDLSRPVGEWQPVVAPIQAVNGKVSIEDPVPATAPQRFYRARETP